MLQPPPSLDSFEIYSSMIIESNFGGALIEMSWTAYNFAHQYISQSSACHMSH